MSTSDYNLRYVHKKSKEIFEVKRIIPGSYSVRHQILKEKRTITRTELVRDYEFQEQVSMENVRRNSQPMVSKSA